MSTDDDDNDDDDDDDYDDEDDVGEGRFLGGASDRCCDLTGEAWCYESTCYDCTGF